MKKIRCAVIGAGWWGTTAHVPALAKHPQADLVAIQHQDEATSRRVASDFDVPNACTTHEQVLDIDGLEAVAISSPAFLHYPQVRAALEQGLHVLVEKPMALSVEQSQELVDLAAARQRELIVGCTYQYTAHAAEARRLVREGVLGRITMISIDMADWVLPLYLGPKVEPEKAHVSVGAYVAPGTSSYSDTAIAGGGQVFTQVSHPGAYIPFLTGADPECVHAQFDNLDTDVDVLNVINARYDNGMLVSLTTNGASTAKCVYDVKVYGTEGALVLGLNTGTMQQWNAERKLQEHAPLQETYPRWAPATNLIEVALGKAINGAPGTHGLSALKLIEAACESSRTGRMVELSSHGNESRAT